MMARWAVLFLLIGGLPAALEAQVLSPGEAEVQKCEERIASVHRELLARYEEGLQELQVAFQKAADLEGSLAVRAERQRVAKEQTLDEQSFVAEPKTLRSLQAQTVTRLQELVSQLVGETVPRLIEYKKNLTVAGKLDEAVTVRAGIEKLQSRLIPLARPEAGASVAAEVLVQAYAGDRARADKVYKGQRITVRGAVAGYRQNAADPKSFLVFLNGGSSGGWVQCSFATSDFRFREDQQFNTSSLTITSKGEDGAVLRLQKGQPAEIRGTCEGFDEMVRLGKCDFRK